MIGKGKKESANFDVLKLSLFFLVMCISLSGGADAASVSTTFNVSATVVPVCQVYTTPVNFGNYAGTDVYASGDVSVKCATGTLYHIAIDAGLYYDGFWRTVSNGNDVIRYGFFKNPCQSSEWGDSDYAGTYIWVQALPITAMAPISLIRSTEGYTVALRFLSQLVHRCGHCHRPLLIWWT